MASDLALASRTTFQMVAKDPNANQLHISSSLGIHRITGSDSPAWHRPLWPCQWERCLPVQPPSGRPLLGFGQPSQQTKSNQATMTLQHEIRAEGSFKKITVKPGKVSFALLFLLFHFIHLFTFFMNFSFSGLFLQPVTSPPLVHSHWQDTNLLLSASDLEDRSPLREG